MVTPGMGEGWTVVGHGRPWQLVESSTRAGRGKGTAWGMFRRVWGCSPREESDQDGLGEEIDDALFFS